MKTVYGAFGHALRVPVVSGAREPISSPWIEVAGLPLSFWIEAGDADGLASASLIGSWNGIDTDLLATAAALSFDTHRIVLENGYPLVRFNAVIASGQFGNFYIMANDYLLGTP